MRRSRPGSFIALFGIVLGGMPLAGQEIKVGGQVTFGDDADFGIGPRAEVSLPWIAPGIRVAGSFDYFFPDSGLGDPGGDYDYRELNFNVLGDISLPDVTNLVPYVGGGVNVAWESVPSDGMEGPEERLFGLNVVAGFRFPLVGFTPFVEARYELEGGQQLLVAGGILLP
ncbi:hypothetical protein [Candidatus Palauibacter sp.]|uniref:hypothetical protein n=1 Tax=Candidatus Palauibacter sp. TaxID=3101350 RepID=UPI003B52D8AC